MILRTYCLSVCRASSGKHDQTLFTNNLKDAALSFLTLVRPVAPDAPACIPQLSPHLFQSRNLKSLSSLCHAAAMRARFTALPTGALPAGAGGPCTALAFAEAKGDADMIQELLYIRPHKVISLSVISLFLGTTFLESTHAAFVFKKPLRAGRRHRWGPGRRGRLARVREHPSGRGRSPSVLLATHPTTGEPARLQERRGALDQRSLAHVRAPPSGRGRSPKLAVSYPRQCRVAAA